MGVGEGDVQYGKRFKSYFFEVEQVAICGLSGSVVQGGVDKIDNSFKLNMYSFHRIMVIYN